MPKQGGILRRQLEWHTDVNHLSAHLEGIDAALGALGGGTLVGLTDVGGDDVYTEGFILIGDGSDSYDPKGVSGAAKIDGTGDVTLTVTDTTDTTSYVALWESATGDLDPKSDGGLTYNAGTGVLTATGFAGPLTGNVTGTASGNLTAETNDLETIATGIAANEIPIGTDADTITYGTDLPTATTIGSGYIYRAGGTDVPIADGGTGASTLTDGGVLLGSGTDAVTPMAVLADGEMIVGDGTTDPVAESGATLRTSIGVGTGDSPQFTAIEVGAASDTTLARSGAGVATIEGETIVVESSVWAQKEIGWTVVDSDTETAVADGLQAAVIPASMNGMNLIDMTCSIYDQNSASGDATTVVLRRVRAGTPQDMTSTGVTIAHNEYTASDETVDTSYDDVATGDQIFVDINAITSGAAQLGLSCTAVFQTP
jgi:hypothetical protein